jgi:hypothetical protein
MRLGAGGNAALVRSQRARPGTSSTSGRCAVALLAADVPGDDPFTPTLMQSGNLPPTLRPAGSWPTSPDSATGTAPAMPHVPDRAAGASYRSRVNQIRRRHVS